MAGNITCSNALTPTISIVEDEHTVITGGLIADGIDVVETMKEQRIQIEALTDMINDMVETKDFNVKWNLEERVTHKKFLEKLGKWIKYVFFVINQDISVDNRISLAYTIYTVRN